MGNLGNNSIYRMYRGLGALTILYTQSLRMLILGNKEFSGNDLKKRFTPLHAILSFGPKSFQRFPSGIKLGRALFVPLIHFFRKK